MFGNCLGTATHMKLLVDFAEMCTNSKKADVQPVTNLFVGQSTGDESKHLRLAFGKST